MALGYALAVYRPGSTVPTETVSVSRAPEVLTLLQTLLKKHPDCHRIRVESGGSFLFAVDCHGAPADD